MNILLSTEDTIKYLHIVKLKIRCTNLRVASNLDKNLLFGTLIHELIQNPYHQYSFTIVYYLYSVHCIPRSNKLVSLFYSLFSSTEGCCFELCDCCQRRVFLIATFLPNAGIKVA